MSAYDEKLREFVALIDLYIYNLSSGANLSTTEEQYNGRTLEHDQTNTSLSTLIDQVEHQIIAGILDDLNLNLGLEAIFNLARHLPKVFASSHPQDEPSILLSCVRLRVLIHRWLEATGLEYGAGNSQTNSLNQAAFIHHLTDFRFNMRQTALGTLRVLKKLDKSVETNQKESISQLREQAQQILAQCDQTRTFMEMYGIKLKVSLISTFSDHLLSSTNV